MLQLSDIFSVLIILKKGSLQQLKLKTSFIKQYINCWEKHYHLPRHRIAITNAFLVSQLSYLDFNSMWSSKDLKNIQNVIDNFINKK